MFAIDDAMGAVVANATQPALGAIKLAWWRERLEELDRGLVPAEPRLVAAANQLLPRRISGTELGQLEEGWAQLLQDPDSRSSMQSASVRGPLLLKLAARLLDPRAEYELADAGTEFAFVDLARRGFVDVAPQSFSRRPHRYAGRIRPATSLWALARRDQKLGGPPFEPEATPGRAGTLLRHRLTGR